MEAVLITPRIYALHLWGLPYAASLWLRNYVICWLLLLRHSTAIYTFAFDHLIYLCLSSTIIRTQCSGTSTRIITASGFIVQSLLLLFSSSSSYYFRYHFSSNGKQADAEPYSKPTNFDPQHHRNPHLDRNTNTRVLLFSFALSFFIWRRSYGYYE